MRNNDDNFKYTVNPDLDEVLDEKGNTAIMLRKVAWGENKKENVEIRKWIMIDDGKVLASKGVTFFNEEGVNNLTHALIKHNFGSTEHILGLLKNREDFDDSLVKVIGKAKVSKAKNTETEELYDPRKELI